MANELKKLNHDLLVHRVAELSGLSLSAIRWNARLGILKGFRHPDTPKIWRFDRDEVKRFVEARRAHAGTN